MKPRLTLLLLLIVVTPLAIVGWLGAKIVGDEQDVLQHRVSGLMTGQLRAVDAAISTALDAYQQRVLEEMRPFTVERDALRKRSRESALSMQFYVLEGAGKLLYPPVDSPGALTPSEREALARTAQIWDGGELLASVGESEATAETGWKAWYWGNGLQMMFWTREGQRIHVAEINRTRLLADLIAALPETDEVAPQLSGGRIQLMDATGTVLYQWGSVKNEEALKTAARIALRAPLSAWSLEYATAEAPGIGSVVAGGFLLTLLPALLLLVGLVLGMAAYFYREQSREMREAAQRVSFVNQVSHELKTPLTNIRMYAEILEREAGGEDERMSRHLNVIVSESQRLSRMIANVLTFSRGQRNALNLRYQSVVPDDVLRTVLEQFRPALSARGIDVELDLRIGEECSLDPDALGQIVGNLVSNVEKYAAEGKLLRMESGLDSLPSGLGRIFVVVEDRGPGVPAREQARIFEPFYRVNSLLTEGVSGTGIGLSISRELARLHGGDVVLEAKESGGSRFLVTLACRPVAAPTEGRPA
ncbi:MAG: HAMP domain-containing sensor histidine kinase [Bryobacterales bacterium]|nr:HAMP domain-containing sensor histidine kinase [Bryobacterales bacterium]